MSFLTRLKIINLHNQEFHHAKVTFMKPLRAPPSTRTLEHKKIRRNSSDAREGKDSLATPAETQLLTAVKKGGTHQPARYIYLSPPCIKAILLTLKIHRLIMKMRENISQSDIYI